MKLCECGCGLPTKIASQNNSGRGHVKGEPRRFVRGHRPLIRPGKDSIPYEVDENLYRWVPLSQGKWSLVSAHRYEDIIRWPWFAYWHKNTQSYYAARLAQKENGERYFLSMHRYILGLDPGDPRTGDHIESKETLNNTDENLRIATKFQQIRNQHRRRNNTSGYKGVNLRRKTGKWEAHITAGGKRICLGAFIGPKEAHEAYCKAAVMYHGEFACFE